MPVEERWVTAGDMPDAVKKAKVGRKSRLGSFTRKKNHLEAIIDGETEGTVLERHYEELSQSFKDLQQAQENLCLLLEEDDEDAADSYLDSPSQVLSSLRVKVSKSVTTTNTNTANANVKAEKDRLFEGSLAAFKTNVESFGNPVAYLTKLSTEKKIS